ncbi:MAG: hypothetical protein KBF15_02985, partial [Parabacteroides sp.]|nr:hypothetical protein [Parabacteroides sp.]
SWNCYQYKFYILFPAKAGHIRTKSYNVTARINYSSFYFNEIAYKPESIKTDSILLKCDIPMPIK